MPSSRCIVIGGTGSLGRVICETLAQRGAHVGFTFHRAEDVARDLTDTLEGAQARRLDLTRTDDIAPVLEELCAALGGLDALVYAAGIASTLEPPAYDALADLTEAGWDQLMAVNVRGAAFACRASAVALGESGGNIVLVGAVNGTKMVPAPVAYSASKAALAGMAQALAKELGPRCIRVNVVAPGVLEAGASRTLPDELRAEYLKHAGLRRFGRFAEVAELVAFLALDNTYVTGRSIALDGGL